MLSPQISRERKAILTQEYNESCKELKCSICLSLYLNPVTITKCKHTFCLECFKKLFSTLKNTKVVDCPICKQPVARRGYFVDKELQEKVENLRIYGTIVSSWDEDQSQNDVQSTGRKNISAVVNALKTTVVKPRQTKRAITTFSSDDSSSDNGVKNTRSNSDLKHISNRKKSVKLPNNSVKRALNNATKNASNTTEIYNLDLHPRRHLVRKARSLNVIITKHKPKKYRNSVGSVNFDTEVLNIDEIDSNTLDSADNKIIDLLEEDCLDNIENEINNIEIENIQSRQHETSFNLNESKTGWSRLKHMKHDIKKKVKTFKKLNVSTELSKKSRAKKSKSIESLPRVVSLDDFELYLSKNITDLQPEIQLDRSITQLETNNTQLEIGNELNGCEIQIDLTELTDQSEVDTFQQLNQSKIKVELSDSFRRKSKQQIDDDAEDDIFSICTQKLIFSPTKVLNTKETKTTFAKKGRELLIDLNSQINQNKECDMSKSVLDYNKTKEIVEDFNEIRLYSPETDNKGNSQLKKTSFVNIPDIQVHKTLEGEIIRQTSPNVNLVINEFDSGPVRTGSIFEDVLFDDIINDSLSKSPTDKIINKSPDDFISNTENVNLRVNNLKTYKRKPRLGIKNVTKQNSKKHQMNEDSSKTNRKLRSPSSILTGSDLDIFDSNENTPNSRGKLKNSTQDLILIDERIETNLSTPKTNQRRSKRLNINKSLDKNEINSNINEINNTTVLSPKTKKSKPNKPNHLDIIDRNSQANLNVKTPVLQIGSNQCEVRVNSQANVGSEVSQRSEIVNDLKLITEKRSEMIESLQKSMHDNDNLISQFSNYLSNSESLFSNSSKSKCSQGSDVNKLEENYKSLPIFLNNSENCPFVANTAIPYLKNIANYYEQIRDISQKNSFEFLKLSHELQDKSNDKNQNILNFNSNLTRDIDVQTESLQCPNCTYDFTNKCNENNNCVLSSNINQNAHMLSLKKHLNSNLNETRNQNIELFNPQASLINKDDSHFVSNLQTNQIRNELEVRSNLETNLNKSNDNSRQIDILRAIPENGSQYSTSSSEIGVPRRVSRKLQFCGSESAKKRKFKRIRTPTPDSDSMSEPAVTKKHKYHSKLLYRDDIDVVFESEMSEVTPAITEKTHGDTQNDFEYLKKLMNINDLDVLKKVVKEKESKETTQEITAKYVSVLEKDYRNVQFPENEEIRPNYQNPQSQNIQIAQTTQQTVQNVQIIQNAIPQIIQNLQRNKLQNIQIPKTSQNTEPPDQNLDQQINTAQIAHSVPKTPETSLRNTILDNLLCDVNMSSFATNDESKMNSEKLSESLFSESYNLKHKTRNKNSTGSYNSGLMSASLFTNNELNQTQQNASAQKTKNSIITNKDLDIILASNKANLNDLDDKELDKEVADITCIDDSLGSEHDLFGDDLIVESTPQKSHRNNPCLENVNSEWLKNIAPPPGFQDTAGTSKDSSKTPDLLNTSILQPIDVNRNLKPNKNMSKYENYRNQTINNENIQSEPIINIDHENIVYSTPQKKHKLDLSASKQHRNTHKYLNPIALAMKEKFSPLQVVVSNPVQKPQICVTPRQKSILNYMTPQQSKNDQTQLNSSAIATQIQDICQNYFHKTDLSTGVANLAQTNNNSHNQTAISNKTPHKIAQIGNNPSNIIENPSPFIESEANMIQHLQTECNNSISANQNVQTLNQIVENLNITSSESQKPSNTNNQSANSEKSKSGVCIAGSRLRRDETTALLSLTRKLNARYRTDFSPNVTHMVVSTDDQNRVKDHTIKYVLAISHSLWVVSFRWVQDCLEKNKFLPEEMYEVLDVSGSPGPKLSRLTRKTHPLFRNYVFHCAGPFISANRNDLENAIISLGGEIRSSPNDLVKENKDEKVCMILSEANVTQEYDQYQMWRETLNVLVVEFEWLSRTVGQYEIANVRPFVLCLEDGMDKLGYPYVLIAPVPETFTYTMTANSG